MVYWIFLGFCLGSLLHQWKSVLNWFQTWNYQTKWWSSSWMDGVRRTFWPHESLRRKNFGLALVLYVRLHLIWFHYYSITSWVFSSFEQKVATRLTVLSTIYVEIYRYYIKASFFFSSQTPVVRRKDRAPWCI